MTNVSINLLLVKFRQQYGLRAFTEGFLVLYVLVTFFHLFVNDLSSALIVRGAHGMVAAALSSLGIYYQIRAPARETPVKSADHRHHRFHTGDPGRASFLHRTVATRRVAWPPTFLNWGWR